MTLLELSEEYRTHADALRERILTLQLLWAQCENDSLRSALATRIRMLTPMWREARELAAVCRHYYEGGYCRNEQYTI